MTGQGWQKQSKNSRSVLHVQNKCFVATNTLFGWNCNFVEFAALRSKYGFEPEQVSFGKIYTNFEIFILPSYLVVDGGWNEWGNWSSCSGNYLERNKTSTRTRTRTCSNPAPQSGGRGCSGENVDTKICSIDAFIICFFVITLPEILIVRHYQNVFIRLVNKLFNVPIKGQCGEGRLAT